VHFKRSDRSRGSHKEGPLLGLGGLGLVAIGLFCLSLTLGAIVIGLIVLDEGDTAPTTTEPGPKPTEAAEPTATLQPPSATSPPATTIPEPTRTQVRSSTATPLRMTPTPSATSRPATAPPASPATATPSRPATATSAPPPSGVRATFLADARRTEDDLMTVKVWFDRLAGGGRIACDTVYAHSIHRPSSRAPSQDPSLAPTWNEYQTAIADGQTCLQWLVDFCDAGGGTIDQATFWDRRELSSRALSRCEHVVQELEGE
jgi:hypothetical protein